MAEQPWQQLERALLRAPAVLVSVAAVPDIAGSASPLLDVAASLFGPAGALLLMLGVGWIGDIPMRLQADHLTATAEVQHLRLPDGSQIVLGSHSAISTQFDGTQRRINLLRGELYVEAAHDSARPMVIDTGSSGRLKPPASGAGVSAGTTGLRATMISSAVSSLTDTSPASTSQSRRFLDLFMGD
mgnify:CR=1 FL=1